MNYYPDNYIPDEHYNDAEWEYACVLYKTDNPTQDQLEAASKEIEENLHSFLGEYNE